MQQLNHEHMPNITEIEVEGIVTRFSAQTMVSLFITL